MENLYERRWNLAQDMNGDGVFSLTDVSAMFKYFLYLPGDGLIYWASKYPEAATFLEISPASYYSTGSLVVSVIVWFFIFGIFGALSN